MYYKSFKPKAMGPLEAFSTFWIQYSNTHDRAPRSEYWWNFIFLLISYILMGTILMRFASLGAVIFDSIWAILLIVPSISLVIRRFHDIDMSGSIAVLLGLLSSMSQLIPISIAVFLVISHFMKSITHPFLIICGLVIVILISIVISLAIYFAGGWFITLLNSVLMIWALIRSTSISFLLPLKLFIYHNINNTLSHFITVHQSHAHISSILNQTLQTSAVQWITLIIMVCCSLAFVVILLTPTQESSYGNGHGKDIIM